MQLPFFTESDPIAQIGKKWSLQLNEILRAKEEARSRRLLFHKICEDQQLLTEDTSVVVFGSLARDEYTTASDADWTLLIDGEANSDHRRVAQKIETSIKDLFKPPNPAGAFGGLTFSHQLIHNIGGAEDTNANTTQRVLMLLESRSIRGPGDGAYGRVVRGILNRYLEQEVSTLDRDRTRYKVPRFLLNDVVRFWRTMAVDFASKQWTRGGLGWGIRTAKLQLSRKLIYVAGLLTCFSCALDNDLNAKIDRDQPLALVNHLRKAVKNVPLAVLAQSLLLYDDDGEASSKIFHAYNDFLGILNDGEKRTHLEKLRAEDAEGNPAFAEVRSISNAFQQGLDKLFFDNHNISPLTRKYGVF